MERKTKDKTFSETIKLIKRPGICLLLRNNFSYKFLSTIYHNTIYNRQHYPINAIPNKSIPYECPKKNFRFLLSVSVIRYIGIP